MKKQPSKKRPDEVLSSQGVLVGRSLDRIRDLHARTQALAACLIAIESWDVEARPTRVSHGNVVALFPRGGP